MRERAAHCVSLLVKLLQRDNLTQIDVIVVDRVKCLSYVICGCYQLRIKKIKNPSLK